MSEQGRPAAAARAKGAIALLANRYPKAFAVQNQRRLPLKLGIQKGKREDRSPCVSRRQCVLDLAKSGERDPAELQQHTWQSSESRPPHLAVRRCAAGSGDAAVVSVIVMLVRLSEKQDLGGSAAPTECVQKIATARNVNARKNAQSDDFLDHAGTPCLAGGSRLPSRWLVVSGSQCHGHGHQGSSVREN